MSQRESRLSRKIMLAIRGKGYFCFKVHGSEYMMAGLPDIIVCAKGRFIGLEVKNPEDWQNVSNKQMAVHEEIRAAEGIAEVVTSPEEALTAINRVLSA